MAREAISYKFVGEHELFQEQLEIAHKTALETIGELKTPEKLTEHELYQRQLEFVQEIIQGDKKELDEKKRHHARLKSFYRRLKRSRKLYFRYKDTGVLYCVKHEEDYCSCYAFLPPKIREAIQENPSLFSELNFLTFSHQIHRVYTKKGKLK